MTNHAIDPGSIPPVRGLEKEEPEIAYEADIPSDDGAQGSSKGNDGSPEKRKQLDPGSSDTSTPTPDSTEHPRQ